MALGTVQSPRAASTFPLAGHGFAGNLKVAWGSYNMAAAPAQNDVIEMCKTPAGATILGGWILGQDIDSGTETLDFDAGYPDDTDAWGNFGVVTGDVSVHLPVAGIYLPFANVLASGGPKTFDEEITHQIIFNAAANAGGTGRLTMVVLYSMP